MGKGKATGVDRDYQVLAQEIVQILSRAEGLIPYEGDGIDIPFEMGGTTWNFDFALKSPDENKIVVGECRRWASPIKQGHVASFAYQVELLRKQAGKEVAGIYVTKTGYQVGAIKAAEEPGIKVIVCREDNAPDDFFITYYTYDRDREIEVRSHVDFAVISLPDEPDEYDPKRHAFRKPAT